MLGFLNPRSDMDFARLALCRVHLQCAPCVYADCIWTNSTSFPCRAGIDDIEDITGVFFYNSSCPTEPERSRPSSMDSNSGSHLAIYAIVLLVILFAFAIAAYHYRGRIKRTLSKSLKCVANDNSQDTTIMISMGNDE